MAEALYTRARRTLPLVIGVQIPHCNLTKPFYSRFLCACFLFLPLLASRHFLFALSDSHFLTESCSSCLNVCASSSFHLARRPVWVACFVASCVSLFRALLPLDLVNYEYAKLELRTIYWLYRLKASVTPFSPKKANVSKSSL